MSMNTQGEVSERVKQVILNQLSFGAACRIHLHRECCRELGFTTIPQINPTSGNRTRICKDMPDPKFDEPFNYLLEINMIKKVADIGGFAFYKLTQKGKQHKATEEKAKTKHYLKLK